MTLRVHGLTPRVGVRVLLHSGICRRPSASVALVGAGRADATGRLASARAVRVRGMPPGIETVADGGHVLTVVEDGRDVACGAIPGMS